MIVSDNTFSNMNYSLLLPLQEKALNAKIAAIVIIAHAEVSPPTLEKKMHKAKPAKPLFLLYLHIYLVGEEITNRNLIHTNVNDKSQKITCYKLLWLSKGNRKKKIIIYKNRSVPFNKDEF